MQGVLALCSLSALFSAPGAALGSAVPDRYETAVKTQAPLEQKYLRPGPFPTANLEHPVPEKWKKYIVWYPAGLAEAEKARPVLVLCNGTGVRASSAAAMMRHFASWGFIILGSEDENSWEGLSAQKSLEWLLAENERKGSVFYRRVDRKAVGAFGHSQGGVGAVNAVTVQPGRRLYKAAAVESPTGLPLARNLKWTYAPEKVEIPVFYLAGSGFFDSRIIIPPQELLRLFELSSRSPFRVMAIRRESDHGEMLYKADGYVTAWFLYWLQGDKAAGAVFRKGGELARNPLYEKVRIE